MVTIRLHNSKTRKKADFAPLDPSNVRMYVCGPTVYDRAHLGNGRPVVVFDTLYRLLRHVAPLNGWGKVTYVRNFTDVDDKINATAQARKAAGDPRSMEALIHERTEETISWYHADMDALGALRPDHEPRATEYIGPMVAMIEGLIAGGHAYARDGHVLFRVRSYKAYGALSGRSVDDMIAGARVEVAPFKEDPMDFVLWKPSSEEEPGWASPWGRGRPGWHIECSAMSYELLGASFDIHGGGLDLQFPHHENEIAQSCCAHPEASFAQVWLHNEMLQVEGKKMSKSLGNFFTVRDLLDGLVDGNKVPGEVIRMVYLSTHYRKPMDWTAEKAREAEGTLRKWRALVAGVDAGRPAPAVVDALADDLNTAGAIAALHELAEALRNTRNTALRGAKNILNVPDNLLEFIEKEDLASFDLEARRTFKASAALLGLLEDKMGGWELSKVVAASGSAMGVSYVSSTGSAVVTWDALNRVPEWQAVAELLRERIESKKARNFQRADEIRQILNSLSMQVVDKPNGPEVELLPDFNPTCLEALK